MTWKSLPGHSSWSERSAGVPCLSGPSEAVNHACHLLAPQASALCLRGTAFSIDSSGGWPSSGRPGMRCALLSGLGQAGVHLESWEVGGDTEEIKESRGGIPGLDGKGICNCSQGCTFATSMGGLSASFRHASSFREGQHRPHNTLAGTCSQSLSPFLFCVPPLPPGSCPLWGLQREEEQGREGGTQSFTALECVGLF